MIICCMYVERFDVYMNVSYINSGTLEMSLCVFDAMPSVLSWMHEDYLEPMTVECIHVLMKYNVLSSVWETCMCILNASIVTIRIVNK